MNAISSLCDIEPDNFLLKFAFLFLLHLTLLCLCLFLVPLSLLSIFTSHQELFHFTTYLMEGQLLLWCLLSLGILFSLPTYLGLVNRYYQKPNDQSNMETTHADDRPTENNALNSAMEDHNPVAAVVVVEEEEEEGQMVR